MKTLFIAFLFTFFCAPLTAQQDEVIATAAGVKVNVSDLSAETRAAYLGRNALVAALRKKLLDEMIADSVLKLEAETRKTTLESIIGEITEKIAPPTEERVRAIYEANREAIGPKTLDEMRNPIVEFLTNEAEQKALSALTDRLKKKFNARIAKDVNDWGLSPESVIAEIDGRPITAARFESDNRILLNDAEMEVYEDVRAEAEDLLYGALLLREAAELRVPPEEFIRSEITDKLREFSDEERERLDSDLRARLFTKYGAKFPMTRPDPIISVVSTAAEPFLGKPDAPVTVIMFSDFQCPTCARTDPVLKKIIAGYGGRVRLVIRDFPLESIHPNAFQAALATNASGRQGRFFEFTRILYLNQDKLGRESLIDFARSLGLDIARFQSDMDDPENAAEVRGDIAEGRGLRISGTPTIFVNGVKIHRLSAANFRDAIETALNGK